MEDAEPTEEDSVAHFVSQLPDHVSITPVPLIELRLY